MNKKLIAFTIIILVLATIVLIFPLNLTRLFDDKTEEESKLKCEEGYILSASPGLVYGKDSGYCRIDKEWKDFKTCKSDDECKQDGYTCVSKDLNTKENERDFRCIPLDNYGLSCWCTINKPCICY